MFKDIGTAVNSIKKLIEKHQDYTVLSITNGFDKGKPYEHCNIYTPVIGHNRSPTLEELNVFVCDMAEDKNGVYKNFKMKKLLKNRILAKEHLEGIEEDIAILGTETVETLINNNV